MQYYIEERDKMYNFWLTNFYRLFSFRQVIYGKVNIKSEIQYMV